MKAFGIEIRKLGTVSGLYSDVDAVLKAAAIPPMGVSAQMQVGTLMDKRFDSNRVTVREHLEQIWETLNLFKIP